MKCDRCDSEATVHEVTVRHGAKVERHLCEACAAQQGLAAQGAIPISNLISKFSVSSAQPAVRQNICPTCRLTFSEFRQTGHLGCPDCYTAFEKPLTPLLERWHEGGTSHAGKVPKRCAATPISAAPAGAPGATPPAAPEVRAPSTRQLKAQLKAQLRTQLKSQLDAAIHAEQYEAAARLRDQLRQLESSAEDVPPEDPA